MTHYISSDQLHAYVTIGIIKTIQKHDIIISREVIDQIAAEVWREVESRSKRASAEDPFHKEIMALAKYIRQTKQDIVSLQPGELNTHHIRVATDELDAIVSATEEAANKIMDVCDEISDLAETLAPEIRQKLIDCNTRIFEASNFQDITGQRITKVVKALKYIDAKVDTLLKILNGEMSTTHAESLEVPNPLASQSDSLMNGPQLPGQGMDQQNIDRLLENCGSDVARPMPLKGAE